MYVAASDGSTDTLVPLIASSVGPTETALVVLAAVLTSAMSAIAGFGGGMVLLLVMLFVLDPVVAVAVHGAVQLPSNASRTWRHRRWVDRRIVAAHCVLLLPGGVLGRAIADRLSREVGRAVIGVFALVSTWKPQWLGPRLAGRPSTRSFVVVGAVQGVANIPIGATGPAVAPFFKAACPERQVMIGTFAAAQTLGHAAKLAVIGLGSVGDHWLLVATAGAATVAGTMLGSRVLDRMSNELFDRVFRWTLTVMGLQLVVRALW